MSLLRPTALVVLLVLAAAAPAAAHETAHIIADAETGAVLSEKNADAFHAPASLTKMMVLYLTFRAIDEGRLGFEQELPVSKAAAAQPAVKLGLRAGRTISVKDAVLAVVTRSSNDVAVVLAEALGGTERRFARTMTVEARRMGMRRTTFRNATGLPNTGQVSSARDMLVLATALIHDFPHHYPLFATPSISRAGRTYANINRLLGRYDGLDGLKTGYTRAAGFNLAASAERDGTRLVVVVLGHHSSRERNQRVQALLDAGFADDGRRLEIVENAEATALPAPAPTPATAEPANLTP